MAASNTPFLPSRLIILSELNTKEKDFYYNLLIRHECKFHHNDQGQFVVNLRLLAPGVKKIDQPKKKKNTTYQTNSFPFEERLSLLQEDGVGGHVLVQIQGVEEFDYNSYPRFSLLISSEGDVVQPRLKLLSWLMRYIEDLYDSRFAHEAAEVNREESYETAEKVSSIFPVFVVKRLSMKLGLRSIVEQTCWDLLYNAHTYRRDYLEVEMFCRFLQEFYDHDDLLFFLYVRSVVAKQLHVSFKTRWGKSDGPGRQPKSLWLSHRECVAVARAVFGDSNESMCRDFLAIVTPQMVGQKTDPPPGKIGGGTDTRRIDITQFLHLAVVGYHQTRPEDGNDESGDHGTPFDRPSSLPRSPSKEYLGSSRADHQTGIGNTPFRTLPGEVNPPVPPIAPSGGDYMSRFAPRSLAVPQSQPPPAAAQHSQSHHFEEAPDYGDHYGEDQMTNSNNVDDDYLLRMAKDREEILEMQRHIEMLNNPQGSEQSFNQGYDYDDHLGYEGNMDLSALAGSYTPIPHSSTVAYDDHHEEDRPPSRGTGQRRPPPKSHPTLADFTKQRQQMAQLEEQFAIPNLTELKRQELADRRGPRGYSDDETSPKKDLWNLSSEHEYHDEIYEDDRRAGEGYEEVEDGHVAHRQGDDDYDPRIFSEIQVAREKEFLELFCERLSGYPEEIAVSIIDELADRLRQKLSGHLDSLGFVSNPDQFDDEVVNYLQSEELQSDLESARDLMIDYVEKRSQQLHGGGGGHDERKTSRDPRDGEGTYEDDDEGLGGGPGQGPSGDYLDQDVYRDEEYSQNDPYENDEGYGGGDYGGYQDDLGDGDEEDDGDDLYEDERRGYGYGGGR